MDLGQQDHFKSQQIYSYFLKIKSIKSQIRKSCMMLTHLALANFLHAWLNILYVDSVATDQPVPLEYFKLVVFMDISFQYN